MITIVLLSLDVANLLEDASKIYPFEYSNISYGIVIDDEYDTMLKIPFITIQEFIDKLCNQLLLQ